MPISSPQIVQRSKSNTLAEVLQMLQFQRQMQLERDKLKQAQTQFDEQMRLNQEQATTQKEQFSQELKVRQATIDAQLKGIDQEALEAGRQNILKGWETAVTSKYGGNWRLAAENEQELAKAYYFALSGGDEARAKLLFDNEMSRPVTAAEAADFRDQAIVQGVVGRSQAGAPAASQGVTQETAPVPGSQTGAGMLSVDYAAEPMGSLAAQYQGIQTRPAGTQATPAGQDRGPTTGAPSDTRPLYQVGTDSRRPVTPPAPSGAATSSQGSAGAPSVVSPQAAAISGDMSQAGTLLKSAWDMLPAEVQGRAVEALRKLSEGALSAEIPPAERKALSDYTAQMRSTVYQAKQNLSPQEADRWWKYGVNLESMAGVMTQIAQIPPEEMDSVFRSAYITDREENLRKSDIAAKQIMQSMGLAEDNLRLQVANFNLDKAGAYTTLLGMVLQPAMDSARTAASAAGDPSGMNFSEVITGLISIQKGIVDGEMALRARLKDQGMSSNQIEAEILKRTNDPQDQGLGQLVALRNTLYGSLGLQLEAFNKVLKTGLFNRVLASTTGVGLPASGGASDGGAEADAAAAAFLEQILGGQ